MSSISASGRIRASGIHIRKYSAEGQAIEAIAAESEAKEAARKQQREKARLIRLEDVERQKEQLANQNDDEFDDTGAQNQINGPTHRSSVKLHGSDRTIDDDNFHPVPNAHRHSDRLLSSDSISSDASSTFIGVDLKSQLKDIEDKYKESMRLNAELDNEKQSLRYEVDLLKDQLESLTEENIELVRENKERRRELDRFKRDMKSLEIDANWLKTQLEHRDRLIEENGLVILTGESITTQATSSNDSTAVTSNSSQQQINDGANAIGITH